MFSCTRIFLIKINICVARTFVAYFVSIFMLSVPGTSLVWVLLLVLM